MRVGRFTFENWWPHTQGNETSMQQNPDIAYAQLIKVLGLPEDASQKQIMQQISDRHPDRLNSIVNAEKLSNDQIDILVRLKVRTQNDKSASVNDREKEALEDIMKEYKEKIMPAFNVYKNALKVKNAKEKTRVSE